MRNRIVRIFISSLAAVVLSLSTVSLSYAYVTSIGGADIPSKYKEGYKVSNCLDLSTWQSKLSDEDWATIRKNGVTAVILRAGYSELSSGQHATDSVFEDNLKGACRAGIRVGVYYFTAALNADEARSEAEYMLDIIRPYKNNITLPVVYDFESNERGRLTGYMLRSIGVSGCTDMCQAFCDKVAEEGYDPMIYASRTVFENNLDMDRLEGKYKIWIAQYPFGSSATGYEGEFYMWQYSSNVRISGLSARLDANYIFEKDEEGQAEETPVVVVEDAPAAGDGTVKGETDLTFDQKKVSENNSSAKSDDDTHVLSEGVSTEFGSKDNKSQVTVTDIDGNVHAYNIFNKKSGYTQEEALMATLFNGYFVSKHDIDPEFIKEKVEPAVMGAMYISGDKLSLEGITEVMTSLKLDAQYIEQIDDDVYVNIKGQLAKGKPVIVSVSGKTELLLGMNENGKAFMADFSNKDKRVKTVSVDNLVKKMNSATDASSLCYTKKQQGGYVMVDLMKDE
ncbi:MAG: GH25 family lysozyme [Firmicutes bacterium]|nr:GH25 family lysozyme [Bacillota bacterium]